MAWNDFVAPLQGGTGIRGSGGWVDGGQPAITMWLYTMDSDRFLRKH